MRWQWIFCFLAIGFARQSNAQGNCPESDTLSKAEVAALDAGSKLTAPYQLFLVDSSAAHNDTAGAGMAMLKTDPYYLLFLGEDATTIDSFLRQRRLSSEIIRLCKERFNRTYSKQHTSVYRWFYNAYGTDQSLRAQFDTCHDSLTCAYFQQLIHLGDSIHQRYLLKYVTTHGWPRPADGGYYAGVLAVHDHAHHDIYISAVKKSVMHGEAAPDLLRLLLYWQHAERGRSDYLQMLDTVRKLRFDVSSLLEFRLPDSLAAIKKALKNHCPAKLYLLFEAEKNSSYIEWDDKAHYIGNRDPAGNIAGQLFNSLQPFCPKSLMKDVWAINWISVPWSGSKIELYIVY